MKVKPKRFRVLGLARCFQVTAMAEGMAGEPSTSTGSRFAVVVASSRVGKSAIGCLLAAKDAGETGPAVRAVLRDASKQDASWAGAGVEVVSGLDLTDGASLKAAFEGVSGALIVAPQTEDRVDIVNSLLDAAKLHGVRHVVLIGGVFQEEEQFLFHRQWMSTRRRAQQLGLAWTQLECSDFMENLLGSTATVAAEGRLVGAFAQGVSAPVALDDIGRAAACVLLGGPARHGDQAYRVVGAQAMTPVQVAEEIGRVTGRPVHFEDVGIEESKRRAEAAGRASWQVQGFADWQELYFAPGRLSHVHSDLPALGIVPVSLHSWLTERRHLFL